MEEPKVGIKLEQKGAKEVEDAFKKVGNAAQGLQGSSKSLTSALTKLGLAGLALASAYKAFTFFKDATQDALEQSSAYTLLNASLTRLGLSYEEARPKVDEFAKSMVDMGRMSTETYVAVARLAVKTGDIDKAMSMAKLASDLAASGLGDYQQNTEYLERVLMGKGARALLMWGIRVKENATITEQLEAIQNRVTVSTEQWADTAEGRIATMRARWQELREELGAFSAITMVNLSNAIVRALDMGGKSTKTFAQFMAEVFNIGIPASFEYAKKSWWSFIESIGVGGEWLSKRLSWLPGAEKRTKFFEEIVEGSKMAKEETNQALVDIVDRFDKAWEEITEGAKGLGVQVPSAFDELEDELKKKAEKIKSTFESLAKTITSKMSESVAKIKSLRDEIKQLGEDTEDQVAKQEKSYKKDLFNLARQSQEKINTIDDEIKEISQSQEEGGGKRILELLKQKQKELGILARLRGEGVEVGKEAAKDELTILKESHEERLKEIREYGQKRILELQKQMIEEEIARTKFAIELLKPGAVAGMVEAEVSAKPWVSPLQQTINFIFQGDVTDKDALMKLIIDTLNRTAALKQFGGQ